MTEFDKISAALPQVKGLGDLGDQELDELAKKAVDAYTDIMDLGMNVEARYGARMFEVAGNMLNAAITAKSAKIDKKLKEIQEEIIFFTEAYLSLEKKEVLRPFDDMNSQIEYWNEKISQDLNLRMLLGKPLDIEMVKTALALNEKAPIKQEILGLLEQTRKQISMEKNGR